MRAAHVPASLLLLAATAHAHAGMFIPTARNSADRDLPAFAGGKSPDTPCTCANGLPTVSPPREAAAAAMEAAGCWSDAGYNYNSHAHNIKTVHEVSAPDCCSQCSQTAGCVAYTFVDSTCYLKNATVGRTPLSHAVSGGTGTKPSIPKGTTGECDMGLRVNGGGQPCLWWSQGCSIGCEECATALIGGTGSAGGTAPHADKIGFGKRFCNTSYNAAKHAPLINATLPREAWTMNVHAVEGSAEDRYRFNPWRAPGYAPVVDACGMAGGKGAHQGIGGDSSFTTVPFASMGDLGSKVLPVVANKTRWSAGASVEVAWGIRYNHGGGYQYRLCPAGQPLTEECMQKMPLEFDQEVGTSLVWNNGTRYNFKNVFVSEGTWPEGSTWARNPIPRVADDMIGLHDPAASCPGPSGKGHPGCVQFPAPCPQDHGREPWSTDGSGQGACSGDWTAGLIVDHVKLPANLPAGDYVLGWRWDCEETAQIWSNCADVTIE